MLANHHLDGQGDIPDLCFLKRVSSDNGKGVIVDGDRAMAGQERLWHFIDAMLIGLEQTEYEFKKQLLTVLPLDGEPVVLPKPEFALTSTCFVINNWSLGQLAAFFKATEFTELEMLESHRNRMTFIQLMSVITQISDSVDAQTPIKWFVAYEQKRKDPLGLKEIWEQDWLSASGPHSQDWIEELLQ